MFGNLILVLLACWSGVAIWFGVQIVSGRDNFAENINVVYFLLLYLTAFLFGLSERSRRARIGIVLVVTQVVCFLVYPNVTWEHGNLFPVAASLLFGLTFPCILIADHSWKIWKHGKESEEQ